MKSINLFFSIILTETNTMVIFKDFLSVTLNCIFSEENSSHSK